MNKIKIILKKYDITLSEFARKLQISRPTMDTYIECYETGNIIQKEKYQIIFNALFNEYVDSREKFMEILENSNELLERDRVLGTSELELSKTDILSSTIDEIRSDMLKSDCDEEVYIFINMFIRSYRKEKVFRNLAKYFITLNGKNDKNKITKQDEVYLSNYYKVFYEDKHNMSKVNNEYLKKFYVRAKEKVEAEAKSKEVLKEELMNKVMSKVDELTNLGLHIDEIDIKKILVNLNFD